MKRIWPVLYILCAPLCVYSGFRMTLDILTVDLGWAAIMIAFLIFAVVPMGCFFYGIRHTKTDQMPRPSLDRHCFRWWSDPLQPLRVTSIGMALYATGALAALPGFNGKPPMVGILLVSSALGILIGELLVYRVFSRKIDTR